jgi:hypothetical protein
MSKAVYDVADGKHSVWVPLGAVSQHLKVKDEEMLEGAMSHAAGKGWLKIGGKPAHSLMIVEAGVQAIRPKK